MCVACVVYVVCVVYIVYVVCVCAHMLLVNHVIHIKPELLSFPGPGSLFSLLKNI